MWTYTKQGRDEEPSGAWFVEKGGQGKRGEAAAAAAAPAPAAPAEIGARSAGGAEKEREGERGRLEFR